MLAIASAYQDLTDWHTRHPEPSDIMEFCLNLSHHTWTRARSMGDPVERTLETIRLADRAGLDSVWLSEDPDGWDAFAVLGAAARTTERVRLGTGVTNPYLRHPNLLAMSIATLDRLSGGRAFLGLGPGPTRMVFATTRLRGGQPTPGVE